MATSRICSIPGCGKPHHARGWCPAHWERWRRHGDPLGGGPANTPNGEAQRYFREVVLAYDGTECLSWPYGGGSTGYGTLHRDGGTKLVHRLVCEHFNGPPPTPDHQAAHSCGKGHEGCCARRHLSWKTPEGNWADRRVHGTASEGERHHGAKLTAEAVRQIRALHGTMRHAHIAKKFGVSQQTIHGVIKGDRWKSVTTEP